MTVDSVPDVVSELHAGLPRVPAGSWDERFWGELEQRGLSRPGLTDGADIVRAVAGTGRSVPLADACLVAGPVAAEMEVELPPGILAVAPERSIGSVQFSRSPDGLVLNGVARRVPWAGQAGHVVLVAGFGARSALVVAKPSAVQGNQRGPFAAHPVADVLFDRAPAEQFAGLPATAGSPLYPWGALARSVQLLGTLEGALAISIDHVRTREQFGHPLAKFQAVQHLLAEFASEVAVARAAVESAYRAARPTEHAAVAKICAGTASLVGSRAAHQVHGAIGFTDDYQLSSLTRSMWALRDEYGDESTWGAGLFDDVVRGGPGTVWERLLGRLH